LWLSAEQLFACGFEEVSVRKNTPEPGLLTRVRIPMRLTRGFARLCEEDKIFLRAWFRVPARASEREACSILKRRAPSLVLEDIENLASRR